MATSASAAAPASASASTAAATDAAEDEYDEYEEENPGYMNNMFGSLFGVAKTPVAVRQKLTENWHRIVRRWYPGFSHRVYCSPPLHFNAVAFKPKPKKTERKLEPYEKFNMRLYSPVRYSSVKSDESQQRMLSSLSAFARRKGLVPQFLVSNMEFQNYLNKDFDWADPNYQAKMTRPDISLPNEEGEIDVLIIDKAHGVFVLEVKAVGDVDEIWDLTSGDEETKIKELHEKFQKKIGIQVEKGKFVIRKLLSDFNTEQKINVRGGFALVNIKRDFLKKALETYDENQKADLLKRVKVKDIETLCGITLCSDDLPPKFVAPEEVMSEEVFRSMDRVWNNFLTVSGEGDNKPMSEDLYERVVARFCGPVTTVKIYTEKTYPRVKLEIIPKKKKKNKKGKREAQVKLVTEEALTKAGAARVMARRFSELVLLQDQIELLQRNEEFVHLEGPPGTGKTLLLLLRILTWLDDGHMVWVVSLSPPSRSVSHVLLEQVAKMIRMNKSEGAARQILNRLRLFMMIRAEHTLDTEYFKRRLTKFRMRAMCDPTKLESEGYPRKPTAPSVTPEHDRKVCLALDETGMAGKGLRDFFQWVSDLHRKNFFNGPDFDQGLSVWSASVERTGRPKYVTNPGRTGEDPEKFGVIWDLKMPLRCPPSVQRALILVQPSLDQDNVCCFTEEMTLSHPAKQTGTSDREIYAADGLPVYLIGHGSHKDCDRDIWFCYECGDELATYLKDTLHIGEEECDCPGKPIIYDFDPSVPKSCPDCKKLTKGSLPATDLPLKFNDVMIIATQRAFQFSLPIGKFALAMKKKGLKVAVNTTREEGKAPIPDDDVILIADVTSVHGLERAIIIIIPEVNDPPPLPDRYRGMLYPEPPYMSDVKKKKEDKKLPKQLQDVIARGRREGKDGIVINAFGEVEDEPADVAMETESGGDLRPATLPPSEQDEAKAAQEVARTEAEDVEMEDDRNAEDRSAEDRNAEDRSAEDRSAEDRSAEEEKPARKRPADAPSAAVAAPETTTRDSPGGDNSQEAAPRGDDAVQTADSPRAGSAAADPRIPYTYNDAFSKEEITAALMSLTPQSRQDVFYIGSRAVCQMILVHLGKDTRKRETTSAAAQPMETE